jgi:hypothetical protein
VSAPPDTFVAVIPVIGPAADWVFNAARWTWHDPNGYNIVSGPLADITLFGGAYAIARRHNCHVSGCWRVGRGQVPGTHYIVCGKHHPLHHPPSAQDVLDAHSRAMERRHHRPAEPEDAEEE